VDNVYPRSPRSRQGFLAEVRATNYGVVRLELIEELYETMYDQMRHLGRDEAQWPHRIMASRHISHIEPTADGKVQVKVQRLSPDSSSAGGIDDFVDIGSEESIDADIVIAATGYNRSAHVDMLKDTWAMLPKAAPSTTEYKRGIAGWNVATGQGERKMAVGRDYRVKYAPGAVADESGIWLQGLCEGTHGVSLLLSPESQPYHKQKTDDYSQVSDTLLSVIATRSGEIVDSIFGQDSKH
jgi:L-ornithine N5-oxygenase